MFQKLGVLLFIVYFITLSGILDSKPTESLIFADSEANNYGKFGQMDEEKIKEEIRKFKEQNNESQEPSKFAESEKLDNLYSMKLNFTYYINKNQVPNDETSLKFVLE